MNNKFIQYIRVTQKIASHLLMRISGIGGLIGLFTILPLLNSTVFSQNKVIVHHSVWAPDRLPANGTFNWAGITHLIIFGYEPNSSKPNAYYLDRSDQNVAWAQAVTAEAHSHGVKVLICTGGIDRGWEWLNNIAPNASLRQSVVNAHISFMQMIGADGIDLDWEASVNGGLWTTLSITYRQALDALGSGKLLFADIGRQPSSQWPIATINQYYDNVQAMLYDSNGWWSNTSGFHNALYDPRQDYPSISSETAKLCADSCMQQFARAGIDKSKTSLGLCFYPRAFSGNSPPIYAPGQPAYPNVQHEGLDNWYSAVYPKLLAGNAETYAPHAAQAWIGSQSGNYYMDWINAAGFAQYVAYTNTNGWGGIMLFAQEHQYFTTAVEWPIGSGHFTKTPLLDDVRAALAPPTPSAPVFTSQPNNLSTVAGATGTFSISVSGSPIPTLQWQKNSVNISGATSASYTTPTLTIGDNGSQYRCIASNSQGVATSSMATLSVTQPVIANPVSDDFSATSLHTRWAVNQPSLTGLIGQGTSDALLTLTVDGTRRDIWEDNKDAPRIMQNVVNGDFEVVTKFQSVPSQAYSGEGILIQQSPTQFLRFDILRQPDGLKFYSGYINGSTSTQFFNQPITVQNPQVWVKVKRIANSWSGSYSVDGTTFNSIPSFTHSMVVASVGVFACNGLLSGIAPNFVSRVDYFFNTASPIDPEDPVTGAPTGSLTTSSDTLAAGGGNVTLTWTSLDAISASIDQGIGNVPLSGSTVVVVGQTKSFTLTLTNALGSRSYVAQVVVALPGGGGNLQDITSTGLPVALITNPTGTGNTSLEVMRDGITPPQGSSNPSEQYDTFNGGGTRLVDWIGYTYSSTQTFGSLIFQEGIHSSNGGFFTGSPKVEIRIGAQWIEVQGLTTTPTYTAGTAPNFATYTFTFNPILGDGIRVSGTPGGTAQFLSVAELRVLGTSTSSVTPDNRPKDYDLLSNFPNPFNPSTTIEFSVPAASHVILSIYNILGQKVRTLVDQAMDNGKWPVTWDGRDEQNRLMSSGIYIYKMQAGDFVATRKMILSK